MMTTQARSTISDGNARATWRRMVARTELRLRLMIYACLMPCPLLIVYFALAPVMTPDSALTSFGICCACTSISLSLWMVARRALRSGTVELVDYGRIDVLPELLSFINASTVHEV